MSTPEEPSAPAPRLRPGVRIALPTVEHFVPVLVAAGAADARSTRPSVSFPVTGFAFGSFTKRSVQYG